MAGDSKVPANGRQTPLSGAIWVPSAVRVRSGLGRKYAVISCALDSSIFSLSASSVGLFASKRLRTCSQVKDTWACARAYVLHNIRAQHKHGSFRIHHSVFAPKLPVKGAAASLACAICGQRFDFPNASCENQLCADETSVR